MPIRDSIIAGAPTWVDLGTSNLEGARDFYGRIFGWTCQDTGEEFGHYQNCLKDGSMIAGMNKSDGSMGPDGWTVYLASLDIDSTLEAVESSGGSVLMPSMKVGDFGTMAMVTDPSGATVGIWQAGEHRGFGLKDEPGAPTWFELTAKNYDATVDFYRSAFGWQTKALTEYPEMNYTVLVDGDTQLAGIMDASQMSPEPDRSSWSVYFGVSDVDSTISTAVENGGRLVEEPKDTPYGRLAGLADPTGALFKLCSVSS